jgi:2-dehydro-3-deoxygluconokinase
MLDESAFRGVPLCVVGSICRDIKTAPITPGEHLLRDGETPSPRIYETLGGGGANMSAMAARLGATVHFAGKVGADALGDRLIRALQLAGVQHHVRRDPGTQTGSSIGLHYTTGHRHFFSHQPNNRSLALDDLDLAALLAGGGHLFRADIWFAEPMFQGGNAALFRAAKDAGLTTSLDINFDPLWNSSETDVIQSRLDAVRALLPLVDVVHGNEVELCRFTGCADLMVALRQLANWGTDAVVLHWGPRGSGYCREGRLVTAPCFPVYRPRHTTGTGDLLSTCMTLLHHRSDVTVEEQLMFANRLVAEYMDGRRIMLDELP